jgi:hypothetical protein
VQSRRKLSKASSKIGSHAGEARAYGKLGLAASGEAYSSSNPKATQ